MVFAAASDGRIGERDRAVGLWRGYRGNPESKRKLRSLGKLGSVPSRMYLGFRCQEEHRHPDRRKHRGDREEAAGPPPVEEAAGPPPLPPRRLQAVPLCRSRHRDGRKEKEEDEEEKQEEEEEQEAEEEAEEGTRGEPLAAGAIDVSSLLASGRRRESKEGPRRETRRDRERFWDEAFFFYEGSTE